MSCKMYSLIPFLNLCVDSVKERDKLVGKRKKKRKVEEIKEEKCLIEGEDVQEFFDDSPPFDENSSFHQMNLSRPLMKVLLFKEINIDYYILLKINHDIFCMNVFYAHTITFLLKELLR